MLDYQDLPLSQATMESDGTSKSPSDDISSLQTVRPLHGRTSGPKRRSRQWNPEEDEILRQAVQQFKGKSWKKIAECFKDRTDVQCLHRWQKVLDPELVKGAWSKEEDDRLIELVNIHGPKKWSTIAQELAGRIGKQCRERWHNHLNPAINKEAWTEEEELILIRAHQAFGNKWAELSKYLPGRSDNAIKNHWHSSVKKKQETYLASGLLAKFPALPNVNHQNQSIPSSSSSMKLQQTSEDERVHGEGAEAEEAIECSQGSTLAGCPQSTSDLGNAFVHIRENSAMSEESRGKNDASSSAAPRPGNYTSAPQDVSCSMLNVPSDLVDPEFLEHTFSHVGDNSMGKDWQFNMDDFPEFIEESSGHYMHCLNGNENHDMVTDPLQTAMGPGATSNTGNIVEGPYKPNEMLDGCRIVYPEQGIPHLSQSETRVNGCGEPADSLIYQSSNYQIPEAGNMAPENWNSENWNALSFDDFEASIHQQFSVPSLFSSENRSLVFDIASDQFHYPQLEEPVQESFTGGCDGFVCPSEFGNLSNDNRIDNAALEDQPDCTKDSSRLEEQKDGGARCYESPPSEFGNLSNDNSIENDALKDQPGRKKDSSTLEEQKDGGALCYEPPHLPSSDVPFLYCGLTQSGPDTRQEYSPFGIRQLLMSSDNCFTPIRLWNSPSRDDSPDAILKSAAKTFTETPSILKKRQRHLVSPLSEKRCEKKLESDLNEESFSNMATELSRVDDDTFDESANEKASTEDKENLHPSSEDGRKEKSDRVTGLSCIGNSERQLDGGGANYHKEPHSESAEANDAMGKVKQPPGVLVEHGPNDMLFSPDRFLIKCDRATSHKALGNQYPGLLEASSNEVTVSSSFQTSCLSVVCSPDVLGKRQNSVVIATPMKSTTSKALENTAETSANEFGAETSNIFGETPFKRSTESPSAWKSPWFMNSLLSTPKYDAEISFKDLAFLMSPGDRSYDAIGLMKQLSEQTAPSIADARQILGSETPETILSEKNSEIQKADENCALLASNSMSEKRALDFSECGTPRGKGKETTTKVGSSNNSVSSSSSYLLKCCR